MSAVSDPYELLGVDRDVTETQLKAAWRRTAVALHPDTPGGDADKFAAASKAYQLLLTLTRITTAAPSASQPQPDRASARRYLNSDDNRILPAHQPWKHCLGPSRVGDDVHVSVDLPPAYNKAGAHVDIAVSFTVPCTDCAGSGTHVDPSVACVSCRGLRRHGTSTAACTTCSGTGSFTAACASCKGVTRVSQQAAVTVAVPRPVTATRTDTFLRKGGPGNGGAGPGTLTVTWIPAPGELTK